MKTTEDYRKRFAELKRYTRFSEEDAKALAELLPHARPEMPRIVRLFYERASEHEEAHAVFQDDEQIRRLQRSLVVWMERILTGPYDDAYCDKSVQIGRVHVEVGLPHRYVVVAMTLFRLSLGEIALTHLPATASTVVQALTRVLDIELALMTESYSDAYEDQIERAQRARELPDRWRDAMNLAPIAVVGLDDEGRIELLNRGAQEVIGYKLAEVVGRSFETLIVDDEYRAYTTALEALAHDTKPDTIELRCLVRARAGHVRELRGRLGRTTNEDGSGTIFLVARDVTEDQAMQARLRRSEKLAAVGTLAAGLAHEIRNPLNGAHLHLTYLKRGLAKRDDHELTEAVDVVSSEVQRLSRLVTDFLDFARPRELRRERASIQEICRTSAGLIRPNAPAGAIDIQLDLAETEIVAEVDPAMIQQVLLNLLTNAVQAVEGSGGTVILRASRRPLDVVLDVIDDGPGLADVDAPVFDAFYSTKEGGTGLGLSIVHRIASDHGGHVNVESRPGATRMRVVLPLSDSSDATIIEATKDDER